MRSTDDTIELLMWSAAVFVVSAAIIVGIAWFWLNASDKRSCRIRGGSVVSSNPKADGSIADPDQFTERHCVGATPEAK